MSIKVSHELQLENDLRQALDNYEGDMTRGPDWDTIVEVLARGIIEGQFRSLDMMRLNRAFERLDGKDGAVRDEGMTW